MNSKHMYATPGRSNQQLTFGDKEYKSANDWEITEDHLKKARDELGETEEKKERYLRELKEKLSGDENARYRKDDNYLLRFLRFKKYNIEKTYRAIKQFYHLRNSKPDYYILPANLESALNSDFLQYYPYTDEKDRMILCFNLGKWNPNEMSFEELCQTIGTVVDIVVMNPKVQINGIVGIWNMEGFTTAHLTELLKKNRFPPFLNLAQSCYPWRVRKILVPYTNELARILYAIIKPFLKRKIADKVVFIGSEVSDLHDYINPELLSEKFGGRLKDEECNVTQHILENLPFLEYERSFVCE